MIHSLILRTATRLLLSLMLIFSVFILWRGHNEPGGGFIGGLIAATAFALHGAAFGAKAMRELLRIDPRSLIGAGLILSVASGLFAAPEGKPYMTGLWIELHPDGGSPLALGTPILFDIGVYLVVVGAVLAMILSLMEEG